MNGGCGWDLEPVGAELPPRPFQLSLHGLAAHLLACDTIASMPGVSALMSCGHMWIRLLPREVPLQVLGQ